MRILITLLFLLMAAGWYGCTTCSTKKVACEGFDEPAFDAWFPYTQGSQLRFKNLITSDTFSYTIDQVYAKEPYETTVGGYNSSRYCIADKNMRSVNNGTPEGFVDIYYSIRKNFNNGPIEKVLAINFRNNSWSAGEITASEIISVAGGSVISSATNVTFENGRTYPLLATLMTDTNTNKTNAVYKLFIAKNAGIVGFETYPSRQKWIIQ